MALTFKDFRNNFSHPNVDPKYISGVNSVNIGPVDQTLELTTDILSNIKTYRHFLQKSKTDISTDNTKSIFFFFIPYYSKVYVSK